ncbi:MAG: helix-turn-helix transcriptional regulator [Oscillospiraceae bacterium]|nr:helix-turn-helix transcriptional regulator [Oscillospiraceae bacterium]
MNSDFPRIISLLRKERGISQKQAAADLGISQALLSHYEKGIRECGLEFLVKAADYYNVSCDYLLGRSPEPAGKTISYNDIPDQDAAGSKVAAGGMMAAFNKKLIVNSTNVLFSLIQKTGSNTVMKEVSSYLMLAIYKMFRVVYSSNSKNDPRFFTVPEVTASATASAAMSVCEASALAAAKGVVIGNEDTAVETDATLITTGALSEEYAGSASSLLNIIKNSEARIQMLNPPQK